MYFLRCRRIFFSAIFHVFLRLILRFSIHFSYMFSAIKSMLVSYYFFAFVPTLLGGSATLVPYKFPLDSRSPISRTPAVLICVIFNRIRPPFFRSSSQSPIYVYISVKILTVSDSCLSPRHVQTNSVYFLSIFAYCRSCDYNSPLICSHPLSHPFFSRHSIHPPISFILSSAVHSVAFSVNRFYIRLTLL